VYVNFRDVTSGSKTRCFYKFRFFSSAAKSFLEVEVNDDLLCYADNTPVFAAVSEHGWVALMEKAYALFVGGYAKLNEGGHCANAFLALTGKPASLLDVRLHSVRVIAARAGCGVKEVERQMCEYVRAALASGRVMTVESAAARPDYLNHVSPHNIVGGHAYSVVELSDVMDQRGKTFPRLLLFNPWNNGQGTGVKYRDCGTDQCKALHTIWAKRVGANVKNGFTPIPWSELINDAEFQTIVIWPALEPFKLKVTGAPPQERLLARQPSAQQRGANQPNYHAAAAAAAAAPPAKGSLSLFMAALGLDGGDENQPRRAARPSTAGAAAASEQRFFSERS
jgi:hypothetical protein